MAGWRQLGPRKKTQCRVRDWLTTTEARKAQGIEDNPGADPSRSAPKGDDLLEAGKANQTKLAGAPVEAPLFEFAPTANVFLRTHLFGDIFERDILDWQSLELATVGMLSAIPAVESQLQSHMRISLNTGLTANQLRQVSHVLLKLGQPEMANRASKALDKQLRITLVAP